MKYKMYVGGEIVSTTAFVLANKHIADYRGGFVQLVNGGLYTNRLICR
ncbi:MAG: hypothetical protein ACI4QT_02115 [Kiritimatiellia bacterium]